MNVSIASNVSSDKVPMYSWLAALPSALIG
jgi:hypothetical protein